MLIGLLGFARSGKSTVAAYMSRHYGYRELAFADPLKEVCKIMFGLNESQVRGEKKEDIDELLGVTPRYIMQKIGTELFRTQIPVVLPELKLKTSLLIHALDQTLQQQTQDCIITDVRFQDEAHFVQQRGGLLIRVMRELEPSSTHASETSLTVIEPGYFLDNSGDIAHLYSEIDALMRVIGVTKVNVF